MARLASNKWVMGPSTVADPSAMAGGPEGGMKEDGGGGGAIVIAIGAAAAAAAAPPVLLTPPPCIDVIIGMGVGFVWPPGNGDIPGILGSTPVGRFNCACMVVHRTRRATSRTLFRGNVAAMRR